MKTDKNLSLSIINHIKKFFSRLLVRHLVNIAILFGVLLVITLCIIGYIVFTPVQSPERAVRINQGESTKLISDKLKESGVIRSAMWFDITARITKSDRKLKAGRYVFGGNISIWRSLKKIRDGQSSLLHITIPEGFSLYKTIRQMEKSGISTFDSLYAISHNPILVEKLTGQRRSSLEGFLYPETYVFDIDIKPEEIFTLMTREFFHRLEQSGIAVENTDDFYRKLVLASIIEQEAVMEDEKPLIASVYINRVKKRLRLESCPTVDYILEQQGIRRIRLLYSDLQINSPYNTYIIDGLPPTPICNPSISSLHAAYNPDKTEYLYFFADFNGRNVFSKTYKEHIVKQRLYQNKNKAAS